MREKKSLIITAIISLVVLAISVAIPLKTYLHEPNQYEMISKYPTHFMKDSVTYETIEGYLVFEKEKGVEGKKKQLCYLDGKKDQPLLVNNIMKSEGIPSYFTGNYSFTVQGKAEFEGKIYPSIERLNLVN